MIFENGLAGPTGLLNSGFNLLQAGSFFNVPVTPLVANDRVPLTRLYINSVAELGNYLTAIFRSVVVGDITAVVGTNIAAADAAWFAAGWLFQAVNGSGSTSLGSQQALQIYNSSIAAPDGIQIPANVTATGQILPRYMPRKCGFTDLVDTLPLT